MTIVELRCTQCEALIELADDCYDCLAGDHATAAANAMRRTQFKKKTECVKGHAFTPENTRIDRTKAAPGGYQVCRACHNIRNRERLMRKKMSGVSS